MERSSKSLACGVDLIVNRTEKFKTGLLSVTLTVPLKEETATAYALIPEVLYRGSCSHPDIESLCAATDHLYGASLGPAVRQRGESQCISFLCSFIDDRYALDGTAVLEPVAELMGEILLRPTTENGFFRRDYVATEGANLADRIRSRVNDKQGWAIFRLIQEMCAGEAYALDKLGSAEAAETMSAETLWEMYQRLLREAQVSFYYGGSAEPLRVESAVRHAFGPLMTARSSGYCCTTVEKPFGEVRTITEQMEVAQGKLAMGFRTGGITVYSDLYPALMVFNAVFGGTAHSKLFMNVREKLGICYHISSQLDPLKGIMAVSAGVDESVFDRACDAILDELNDIRSGKISAEERNAAVRAIVSALMGKGDSQSRMEDSCVTRQLLEGKTRSDQELIRAVEAVEVEDIARVANCIFLDTVYRLAGEAEESWK